MAYENITLFEIEQSSDGKVLDKMQVGILYTNTNCWRIWHNVYNSAEPDRPYNIILRSHRLTREQAVEGASKLAEALRFISDAGMSNYSAERSV